MTVYKGKDGSEYELVEDLAKQEMLRLTKIKKPGIAMGGDKAYDVIALDHLLLSKEVKQMKPQKVKTT